MATDLEKTTMCTEAVHLWGTYSQILMGVEEAAELIVNVCKFGREQKTKDDVAGEIADNRVMAFQIMHMLGITEDEVKKHEDFKWARLKERIEADKQKRHERGRD
jgi:hypothetical protein